MLKSRVIHGVTRTDAHRLHFLTRAKRKQQTNKDGRQQRERRSPRRFGTSNSSLQSHRTAQQRAGGATTGLSSLLGCRLCHRRPRLTFANSFVAVPVSSVQISCTEVRFPVSRKAADLSGIVKDTIGDVDDDDDDDDSVQDGPIEIVLPNVTSEVLTLVVNYLEHYLIEEMTTITVRSPRSALVVNSYSKFLHSSFLPLKYHRPRRILAYINNSPVFRFLFTRPPCPPTNSRNWSSRGIPRLSKLTGSCCLIWSPRPIT
jgi:Skp1 family, tetramerisation domain